jgi:lysosomal acid lipase/cholesteryl ester hydrolase
MTATSSSISHAKSLPTSTLKARPQSPAPPQDASESSPLLPDPLAVHISRPTTPSIHQHTYLSHPLGSESLSFEPSPSSSSFVATSRGKPPRQPTRLSRFRLFITQTLSNTLSAVFLVIIVVWALSARFLSRIFSRAPAKTDKRDWDNPDRWKHEQVVKSISYYAETCGFAIKEQTVETDDGYFLSVHKVTCPRLEAQSKGARGSGFPVLIMHGLFQTSGSFVTSEERSLAFWLADRGYDATVYF